MSQTFGGAAPSTTAIVLRGGDHYLKAELDTITDAMVKEIKVDLIGMWDLGGMDWDALDIFAYEGFDPVIVYKHLALVRKDRKAKINGYDDNAFKVEFFTVLGLQVIKGNVTAKNFKSFSEEAQKQIGMIMQGWRIALNRKEDKKLAVTLPRIAAAFPYQTCIVAGKKARAFLGPFDSSQLPTFMLTPVFASVIPIGHDITTLLTFVANCFACDQSAVLDGKNYVKLSDEERLLILTKQFSFTNAALNSPVLSQVQRIKAVLDLKLKDHYKVIAAVALHNKLDPIPAEAVWNADFAAMLASVSAGSGPI